MSLPEYRRGEEGMEMFIKNRYYPGKLLHASDFVREQEYGNAKLDFLNRRLHGWGILQGLEVRSGEQGSLRVTAGSALDPGGRLIVVPEDTTAALEELEGAAGEGAHGFILGICYEEKPIDRERSLLCEKETYEDARIAESFRLRACSPDAWERLTGGENRTSVLMEERVLYEDGEVRLTLRYPRVVPEDSIFKVRMQATAPGGSGASIGWRCTVKLQGAFFTASGKSLQVFEERPNSLFGSLCQEWQICTEEYRKQTVAMEVSRLEIYRQGSAPVEAEACQTYIETAASVEEAVRGRLQGKPPADGGELWVPLARIRVDGEGQGRSCVVVDEPGLRRQVARSAETEAIRRAAEESGIIDISWRGLLKSLRQLPPVQDPSPPSLPAPAPAPGEKPLPGPPAHIPGAGTERYRERVHRGIAVIPIPKHYRKGDTLYSEEISHGFPGEEVLVWLSRIYEEPEYAYWEKNRTRHAAVHGADDLFADGWDSGWEIRKQALRQEVEVGTFQVAVILSRGRRKRRSREVAISWTAVRLTGTAEMPRTPGVPRAGKPSRTTKSF